VPSGSSMISPGSGCSGRWTMISRRATLGGFHGQSHHQRHPRLTVTVLPAHFHSSVSSGAASGQLEERDAGCLAPTSKGAAWSTARVCSSPRARVGISPARGDFSRLRGLVVVASLVGFCA
jgi:hypothetical protein